mgnify:CR=1 FL=1
MTRIWDQYLDPRDARVYSGAGLGKEYGMGKKPALIIVDMVYGFTGDKPEPIEESIKQYPFSCGAESWESIKHIQRLLHVAREVKIPVYYTAMGGSRTCSNEKMGIKGNFWDHPAMLEGEKGTHIVKEIEPIAGERVITKLKPSAFFGTPLVSYLTDEGVDTVIIVGTTTSGCIRATAVDAFSYNYNVIVPEECVFDRGITTHAINLFDMQQKYADVLSVDDVIERLRNL